MLLVNSIKTTQTVLRSTAPAPLGVRKVHKIVYNIASIFNFGLALRALAAVLPVLRSTAPAPLGVRKVHKIVYNIASIFNFGLALRALAAVLPSYYTRGRGVGVDLVVGYYPGVVLGVWG